MNSPVHGNLAHHLKGRTTTLKETEAHEKAKLVLFIVGPFTLDENNCRKRHSKNGDGNVRNG